MRYIRDPLLQQSRPYAPRMLHLASPSVPEAGGSGSGSGRWPVSASSSSRQIYDQLRGYLQQEQCSAAPLLPSEQDLRQLFGTGRNPLRLALRRLDCQGFVRRRRGEGTRRQGATYEYRITTAAGLREAVEAAGGHVDYELRRLQTVPSAPFMAAQLRIAVGARVRRVESATLVGGERVTLWELYIPETYAMHLDCNGFRGHIDSFLGHLGPHAPASTTMRVSAETADREIASVFGIPGGAPLLHIDRRTTDAHGHVLLVAYGRIRADRLALTVTRGASPEPA